MQKFTPVRCENCETLLLCYKFTSVTNSSEKVKRSPGDRYRHTLGPTSEYSSVKYPASATATRLLYRGTGKLSIALSPSSCLALASYAYAASSSSSKSPMTRSDPFCLMRAFHLP